VARCAGTLPIGQVMIAKIRWHALRHNSPPGCLLSEIGAELGSPFLEFGQLGPQAPDLAVDARQLRPGLLLADVTVAVPGPGEGLDLAAEQSQARLPAYKRYYSVPPAGLVTSPNWKAGWRCGESGGYCRY
jgi:hypothetical protein